MLREQTAGNPERLRRALAGLRAYQEAPRPAPLPLMPAIAEAEGASLRDYGGRGAPVLFIPSLINPPTVLDLSPERSLLRWLAGRGHRVLLLDWGSDSIRRRAFTIGDHVERVIVPLIRALGEPAALVGYCLGGTMAVAAAAIAGAPRVAAIAAPWHFGGFPETARERLTGLWRQAKPMVEALGLLPMEVLQSAFWSLDPARTVAKFEAFAEMPPDSEDARAFVALEDWANDGPPLPEAAARELFEDFLEADRPGRGEWAIAGRSIAPEALPIPLLNIVSTTDRIVPHASAIRVGERIDLARGHVGMIVGSRASEALWEPLDRWLSSHPASW